MALERSRYFFGCSAWLAKRCTDEVAKAILEMARPRVVSVIRNSAFYVVVICAMSQAHVWAEFPLALAQGLTEEVRVRLHYLIA